MSEEQPCKGGKAALFLLVAKHQILQKAQCDMRRPFEELHVSKVAAQKGKIRFPSKDDESAPRLAHFRNNLTALSQYGNLYFLATHDKIAVYRPCKFDESLPPPAVTIQTPNTGKGQGHIDPSLPHSINHLVVADLGIDEIVVTAHDDGDVIAYSTRPIRKAIETQDVGIPRHDEAFFRPFFVTNVGDSAWGIAVHKEARMLAVSSNTRFIKVFAFALCQSMTDRFAFSHSVLSDEQLMSKLYSEEWFQPKDLDRTQPGDRSRNIEITLGHHVANIPSIAFFNRQNYSQDDVYLASTDIVGGTVIWNVWNRAVVTKLMPETEMGRGWGVACIDPQYCKDASSKAELFGYHEPLYMNYGVDITDATTAVPDSDIEHPRSRQVDRGSSHSATIEDRDGEGDWDIESDDGEDYEESESSEDDEDGMGIEDDLDMEDELDHSFEGPDDMNFHIEDDSTLAGQASHSTAALEDIVERNRAHGASESTNITATAPDESCFSSTSSTSRQLSISTDPSIKFLPFFVLQTSKFNINLLHSIRHRRSTHFNPAHMRIVSSDRVLYQLAHKSDHQVRALSQRQRLNMILQIPELSVVVVGDQMGRAAILTLTVLERKSEASHKGLRQGRGKVGFRFERFLPFASQEDAGERPVKDLVGIAAGPIMDTFFKREDNLGENGDIPPSGNWREQAWRMMVGRKYRLFLYYRDHTVLSYELARPRKTAYDDGLFGGPLTLVLSECGRR